MLLEMLKAGIQQSNYIRMQIKRSHPNIQLRYHMFLLQNKIHLLLLERSKLPYILSKHLSCYQNILLHQHLAIQLHQLYYLLFRCLTIQTRFVHLYRLQNQHQLYTILLKYNHYLEYHQICHQLAIITDPFSGANMILDLLIS